MSYLVEILFHIIISSSAIVLNSLLLLATFHRTKTTQSYQILMKIQTAADLAAALSILTTLQRTIPCEWSFVFISHGPCTIWGGSACFSLYVMMITAYTVSFTNVLVCMGARYWFLKFGSISRTRIIVPCILCSGLPAVLIFLRTLLTRIDDSEAERMLHRHYNYSTEYLIVTGTNNMQSTSMFIGCSCTFFAPFPVMLCIWIYRAKMLTLLNEKKRNLSVSTRLLHKHLTLQALLPSFTLISISLLFIGFNNIYNGPLLEVMVVFSNEMPTFFSPIIVITHVGHYKKIIRRMFKRSRNIEIEVASRTQE